MKTLQKRNGYRIFAVLIALSVFLSVLPVQIGKANFTTPSQDIEQLIADVKLMNLQNGFINFLDAKLDEPTENLGFFKNGKLPEGQVFIQAELECLKVVLTFKNKAWDRWQIETPTGQYSLPA